MPIAMPRPPDGLGCLSPDRPCGCYHCSCVMMLYGHVPGLARKQLEFPGQVAGTLLVTIGLLAGMSLIVALGAAVNLAASLW